MSDLLLADESTQALGRAVERQVRQRTWDRVRDLRVEVSAGRLVVRGRAATYYVKQLAVEAVRGLLDPAGPLPVIDITVV